MVLTVAITVMLTGYIALLLVLKGPSPTVSDMVVSTMWETRRGKAIINALFTDEEIEQILAQNSVGTPQQAEVTDEDNTEWVIPEDEKDDTDYGDGDEGSETEPTGSQPITTITPITTTTPATTQQTTTTNGTIQTPAASTEQHVGGGYSGSGGFSYDSTQTDTDEEQLEQQAASSIDNIINGRAAPKIPTSSAPIAKAQAARTTGSSVIPAASGLAAAAVIGLGAKAFLDKKKETEEEEEEEMFS